MVSGSKPGSPGSTKLRRFWGWGSRLSRLGVVRRMPTRDEVAQRRDKAGRRPPGGLGLARREQRNRMWGADGRHLGRDREAPFGGDSPYRVLDGSVRFDILTNVRNAAPVN